MASLTNRLARLLGRGRRTPRQTLTGAAALRLPVEPLDAPTPSIFWDDNLPLHRLHDLPRSALSGPVQEDKAHAHAALVRLIHRDTQSLPAFDLRQVNGFSMPNTLGMPCESFEHFAGLAACRTIRIISYKDFVRTINLALPGFSAGPTVELLKAGWLGERIFWAGEQQAQAFACAIAYARLRGLELPLPCNLTTYTIAQGGLTSLAARYHLLAMPADAWSDREFMRFLLDDGIPYARLRLGQLELLILSKHQAQADALGQGLKEAGMADFVAYLYRFPQT